MGMPIDSSPAMNLGTLAIAPPLRPSLRLKSIGLSGFAAVPVARSTNMSLCKRTAHDKLWATSIYLHKTLQKYR